MLYSINDYSNIEVVFTPLDTKVDLYNYVRIYNDQYWIGYLQNQYTLTRLYSSLPSHRDVVLTFDLYISGVFQFDTILIAIDGKYQRIVSLFP